MEHGNFEGLSELEVGTEQKSKGGLFASFLLLMFCGSFPFICRTCKSPYRLRTNMQSVDHRTDTFLDLSYSGTKAECIKRTVSEMYKHVSPDASSAYSNVVLTYVLQITPGFANKCELSESKRPRGNRGYLW